MNSTFIKLLNNELDGILISNPVNITYLLGVDFGFSLSERECLLLITKNLPASKAGEKLIITDKRYSEVVKKQVKTFTVIDTGIHNFLKNESEDLFKKLKIKTVGFEENNLTVSEYNSFKKIANLKPIDLNKLRIIKTDAEIKNIKLACKIADQAFSYILKKIKLGISEKEIANLIESFIKEKNAETSFKSIVAFGKNSSIPHHQTSDIKLKKDQIILLDFGVKFNNYCSDMTRTVFFGSATTEFKRMYKAVLTAQEKAIQYINSQLSMANGKLLAKDIDKIAREYILKQGFPNIIHSVGHGIGIEVHEAPHISPNSNETIKDGMVFSVEPGIYIEGYGGIRIEDLVMVTAKGGQLISNARREIIEVYAR